MGLMEGHVGCALQITPTRRRQEFSIRYQRWDMTNCVWLDSAYRRGVHRDRLNIIISGVYSYAERDLARDALCVLDAYEALRVERLNALDGCIQASDVLMLAANPLDRTV